MHTTISIIISELYTKYHQQEDMSMPKKRHAASHWKTRSIIASVNLVLRGTIVLMALLSPSCCQSNGEVYDLNSDQSRHNLPEKGTGHVSV